MSEREKQITEPPHISLTRSLRGALAAETTREGEVLGLDRHALRVDGGQVRVLEEGDEVRLTGLLQREHSTRLEAQIRLRNAHRQHTISTPKVTTNLEILRDLTDETLERQLADEELRALLVATDFTQGDGTGAETMRLLHTSSGGLDSSELLY